MTLEHLTTEVADIVSPFLTKGMDGVAGEAGKSLVKWVSEKLFAKHKNKLTENAVKGSENISLQQIKDTLQLLLTQNISLIPELTNLLAQAKAEKNITVHGVYQNHTGTGHNIAGNYIAGVN